MQIQYTIIFLVLLLNIGQSLCWGQTFEMIDYTNNTFRFSCQGECIHRLTIHNTSNEGFFFDGIMTGNGTLYLGYRHQQGIIPRWQKTLSGTNTIKDIAIIPKEIRKFIQYPQDIYLIVQGSVVAHGLLEQRSLHVKEKIVDGWKNFWQREGITFYGINLRRGRDLLGFPMTKILTILGLIILFGGLLINVHPKSIIIGLLCCRGIIGIRHRIDSIDATHQWVHAFRTKQPVPLLGTYYTDIEKIRGYILSKDNAPGCSLSMHCAQERPFCTHAQTVFLQPCSFTTLDKEPLFVLGYGVAPTVGSKYDIITQWNNVILYRRK